MGLLPMLQQAHFYGLFSVFPRNKPLCFGFFYDILYFEKAYRLFVGWPLAAQQLFKIQWKGGGVSCLRYIPYLFFPPF